MSTKPYYLSVFLLVIIGLFISFFLIPSERELALMNLKDKRFEEARFLYEKRFQRGDHTGGTVTPLIDLYLQVGRVDDAIKTMEIYVADHPKEVRARERLGTLYQYGQKTGDYLKNLEILTQMEPSAERLRQLSYLYNFNGQYDKQIDVLKRITTHFKATEQDHLDLAYLQAERDNYKDAVPVIQRLIAKDPKKVSSAAVEFGFSLMLDNKQDKQAVELAQNYIQAIGGIKSAILFSSRLRNKGRNDLALEILKPFMNQVESNPALLREYVALEVNLNRRNDAFNRLYRIYNTKGLKDDLLVSFIELLAERKEPKLIHEILDKVNLNNLPQRTLIALAEGVIRTQDKELAEKFAQKVQAQVINTDKTVATMIAVATNAPDAQGRIDALRQDPALLEKDRLFLANIFMIQLKKEYARQMMDGAKVLYYDTETPLFETVQLYIQLDLQDKALALLGDARKSVEKPSPALTKQFDYSWALLSAGTGKSDAVVQWLETQKDVDPQLVKDLLYVANKNKAYVLELVTAQRVYEREKTFETTADYAQALVNTGHVEEALPLLKTLADKKPDWAFAYAEALDKMGNRQEVGRLWKEQLNKYTWTDDQLRSISYVLLKNGYKKEAEGILMRLASKAGPNSQDIKQLVYIWGPRPGPEAVKWLEARAKAASGKERDQWLAYVSDMGSVDQLRDLVQKDFDAVPPQLLDEYLQRLGETKDKARIQQAFTKAMDQTTSPERLKKIGMIALNTNQADLAESIFKKILENHPQQVDILREMGKLTLFKARYTEAKKYFQDYFKAGGDDYQSNFYYGQILTRDKQFKDSLEYYNKAQAQIEVLPENKKSMETDLMEAQILYHRGMTKEAVERYKKLVQERPGNKSLRTDVIYLLMDAGRYEDAERILSGL